LKAGPIGRNSACACEAAEEAEAAAAAAAAAPTLAVGWAARPKPWWGWEVRRWRPSSAAIPG